MADAVVGTIVEKLSAVATKKLSMLLGVRRDMQDIIRHLNMMKACLKDAEERPERGDVARAWAKEVQELAYDAEDCIDEFMLHLGQPTTPGLLGALQRFTRCLCTLKTRHRLANQIQEIKFRVEDAKHKKELYGLSETTPAVGPTFYVLAPLDPQMAALFVEEVDLVGIDKPKQELIGWLIEENKPQLGVISVVGMGGLGKTTLVRKVYESEMLSHLFSCRAWITVSKFLIEDLLRDMILQFQIPEQEVKSLRHDRLVEKLRDHLKGKRYLIVFDDIWTISMWDSIKLVLPDSSNGSRVMVTTRIESVANTCCSAFYVGHVHTLQPLSNKQSWDLFYNRVFKDTRSSSSLELEDLSKAIMKKCNRLPLAIVTIAGLLASKPNKTREEWQRVYDRLGSELETNRGLEGVKLILNLSYDDLPYSLRPCFLYLSKYPEDYEIKRREVTELWVAEGFARGTQNMSAEEVAEGYFDEFINRSMIQPSKINWDGKVKTCRVHDMMLEVMVSKSTEQNLLVSSMVGEQGTTASIMSQGKIRRLSINIRIIGLEQTNLSYVRSITIFGSDDAHFLSPQLRLLKVLDLQGEIWLSSQQLKWIGELIHLKYLSIEVGMSPCDLPKSWGNFCELETLNMGSTNMRLTSVAKLQKLRHLRGHDLSLPKRGIENLKSLQILDSLNCRGSEGQVIEKLGELTQLRHLHLSSIEPEITLPLSASLAKLNSCLRSLKISSPGSSDLLQSIYPLLFYDFKSCMYTGIWESCLVGLPP